MTSKEALGNLRWNVSISQDLNYKENNDLCDIIEKDLSNLEWLKSKLNLTFLNSLGDYRDRLKVMEIMGYKYEKEIK